MKELCIGYEKSEHEFMAGKNNDGIGLGPPWKRLQTYLVVAIRFWPGVW